MTKVSIRVNGQHHCGGAVLNENYTITAAHCLRRKGNVTIYAGSVNRLENGTEHVVKHLYLHEKYDYNSRLNDIALIMISPPFTFHSNLQPVDIPSTSYIFPDNTDAIISGWGLLQDFTTKQPVTMKKAIVTSIDSKKCGRKYSKKIFKGQMCAQGFPNEHSSGRDACQGDSGGPLVYNHTLLIGIISWGRGCAEDFPGVFTKVSYYHDWIVNHTT
ncbi:transmembrane protease serine 11C-like isoform X2 [Chrysoperla carnea]|uniref:transmembrane protease serine 11C-like isoform X2 n=1 Tax=Chrysoperla carnea TaxID=189513 RepID=UPI001D08B7A1|nr:transmembrane protease serine 11C-like isoform X2 [Chrysoperla carnea]